MNQREYDEIDHLTTSIQRDIEKYRKLIDDETMKRIDAHFDLLNQCIENQCD